MELLLFLIFVGFIWWARRFFQQNNKIKISSASTASAKLSSIEQDAWEPFNFYRANPVPATGDYRIHYMDSSGLESEREISVKRVDQDGDHSAIAAFCQLRKAHRTFLNDRIRSAVDISTGEVVKDVAEHAITTYKTSPAGAIDELIAREIEGLGLLLFVARADGRMLKPERVEIARYLKSRDPSTPISEEAMEDALKELGVPDSMNEFRRNVRTIAEKGDKARMEIIFNCAKAIVATQKKIDPAEEAALKILENAVSEIPA